MIKTVSVRSNAPRRQWRAGDKKGALAFFIEQLQLFKQSHDDAPIEGDIFALEYLQMLLHRGIFEEAAPFLRRLTNITDNLKGHFYILDMVTRFCLAHSRDALVETAEDTIFAVLPIWGSHYLDVWEHAGISAFLSEDAFGLYHNRRVEFFVFTKSTDKPRLSAMPMMRELARHATVRFFNLDVILDKHGRRHVDGMNIAHWATLTLAKRQGAGVLLLFADTLYSQGSVAGLDATIRARTHDIFFTIDLQLDHHAWEVMRDTARFPGGPKSATSANLLDLYLRHPALRENAWRLNVEEGVTPLRPFRLSRVEEKTAELRTFLPQPFYISADLVPGIFAQVPIGLDYFAVEAAWVMLGGADRMRVLDDSEEFLCATIDTPGTSGGPWSQTITCENVIKETLENLARRNLLGHAREWAFSSPLKLGKTNTDQHFETIRENIHVFRTPKCMSHTEYLNFVKDVSLPAFDSLNLEKIRTPK